MAISDPKPEVVESKMAAAKLEQSSVKCEDASKSTNSRRGGGESQLVKTVSRLKQYFNMATGCGVRDDEDDNDRWDYY